MLKKLAQLLNADLTRRTSTEESEHPYFGRMVLYASKSKPDSYWEASVRHDGDEVDVFIQAPDRAPPSAAAVEFAKGVLADPDAVVARALPRLAERYLNESGKPMPADWRSVLRLSSFEVPAAGDPRKPWSLTLAATDDPAAHRYICRFVGGECVNVTADT